VQADGVEKKPGLKAGLFEVQLCIEPHERDDFRRRSEVLLSKPKLQVR
jgi:hypothetical protein